MYLLFGYLQYGNYGDELLASLLERKIKKLDFAAEFEHLSSKNNFWEHCQKLLACRQLICLGGLFQDKSSARSPLYYFLVIFFARLLGKRVRIIAQGIGPLQQKKAKTFSYLAFKLAHEISVRDRASSLILEDWKIDHYYGSDVSWLLAGEKQRLSHDHKARLDSLFTGLPDGTKLTALSLKQEKSQNEQGIIDKIIGYLHAQDEKYQTKMPVLIFEMQEQDSVVHKLFQELDYERRGIAQSYYIKASDYSPEELLYILKTYCRSAISMRLHALIMAKLAGLEITAIAIDPKINELSKQIDIYSLETLQQRAEKSITCV